MKMNQHSHNSEQRDTGTALITALFIMTLVAITATAMSLRFQIDVHRTRLTINAAQTLLAAQAVEFWAIGQLKKAATTVDPKHADNKIDNIPLAFPAEQFPYPQVTVRGQLDDLQAKFNLNSLAQTDQIPRFTQLLMAIVPNLQQPVAVAIANALNEWLTPSKPNASQTSTSNFYNQQQPPYQIPHTSMVSISEFRLIQGVSAELYQKVAPYICALPTTPPININTASIPVLQTLGVGLTNKQAQLIIANRGKDGYASTGDLSSNPQLKDLAIPANQITIISNYFLATAVATIDQQQLTVYTTFERKIKKDSATVDVIRQSINTL